MKQKSLILLSLVTVVVVVAAVILQRPSGASGPDTQADGEPFLAGLMDRINDVARIDVTSGGQEVVAVKQNDDWVLETQGGYPAKFETVKAALVGLAQLEKAEGKTSNPDYYDQLGVQAPSEGPGSSTRVVLQDASGATLASVILGNPKGARAPQLYVRSTDDPQAWLVDGRVNLRADPNSWMERQFANIAQDRIASVEIRREDEPALRIWKDRPSDTNFQVSNVPADRELISPSIANSIASGLSYLSLEEVKPAEGFDFDSGKVAEAEFRTWDGLVVRVETTHVDGQGWIRLSASSDTPPEPVPEPVEEGEEASEPKPYDGETPEELATEVDELNQRVENWVYRVAEYKLSSFEKRLDELLREPEAEAGSEAAADDAPAKFDPLSIDDGVDGDMGSFEDLMKASGEQLDQLESASKDDDAKDEAESDEASGGEDESDGR